MSNLTENIIKLCNQLRSNNFDQYADEIENNFISYKRAENYKGEDAEKTISDAHPEGDVNLFDKNDDLGVVETITSRHKKILDVVNKNPKISKANQNIIKFVKKIFAEDTNLDLLSTAYDQIKTVCLSFYNTYMQNQYQMYYIPENIDYKYKPNEEPDYQKTHPLTYATFQLKNKFDVANYLSVFTNYYNSTKNLLEKSDELGQKEEAKLIENINYMLSHIIIPIYEVLNNSNFFDGKNIYNADNLDVKKAGYNLWQRLKLAQYNLETIRTKFTEDQVSQDLVDNKSIKENYIDPSSLSELTDNAFKSVNKFGTMSDKDVEDWRKKFKVDLSNLIKYFSHDIYNDEAKKNQEFDQKSGKFNPSKFTNVLNNKAFNIMKFNSSEFGVNISDIKSYNDYKNLLDKWVAYFNNNKV